MEHGRDSARARKDAIPGSTWSHDPPRLDWGRMELPETWPDRLDFRRAGSWWRFGAHALGLRRSPVLLPPALPGTDPIPRYVLQEFHNLPGGNYSRSITRGYATGFDRVMLGTLEAGRARIARALADRPSVLDIGCGAGHTAIALRGGGAPDVWGLDPSPYLLQHAARRAPEIGWVQGVAERLRFEDGRFDGISACFVFHEMPSRRAGRALAECVRVLRPGGRLVLLEPSALQLRLGSWRLWRRFGWRGVYFRGLAHFVYEPFLRAWHRQEPRELLAAHGLEVELDEPGCPLHFLVARKPA